MQILEEYANEFVHSATKTFRVPKVVRMLKCMLHKYVTCKPTKHNIYLRDEGTCQYCGKKLKKSEATLDHLKPKSKGGRNTWENLVLACYRCNQRKGNKLLRETGMRLRNYPHRPSRKDLMRGLHRGSWGEWL